MSIIINLNSRRSRRESYTPIEPPASSGEILFFTGVRYVREAEYSSTKSSSHEQGPNQNKPKPKRA